MVIIPPLLGKINPISQLIYGKSCLFSKRQLFYTQILATPVLREASATAFATAGPTRSSNAAGMI
jgi:hypothetical protein